MLATITIRPEEEELDNFEAHWHIIQAPGFKANPAEDGTRAENFAVISLHKTILIGEPAIPAK